MRTDIIVVYSNDIFFKDIHDQRKFYYVSITWIPEDSGNEKADALVRRGTYEQLTGSEFYCGARISFGVTKVRDWIKVNKAET